jgi:hypothetical protein
MKVIATGLRVVGPLIKSFRVAKEAPPIDRPETHGPTSLDRTAKPAAKKPSASNAGIRDAFTRPS